MNLAVARRRMGDAAQAAAMLEAVAPQLANNEDPEASGIYHSALNNLATAYRELGRDADARRAWERLAGRLASVGDRESWARVSSNLSTLLADLGDLEAAERTARQAVDAWRVVRGDGDVDTALATVNLGSVLGARGQWAAAAESVAAGHAVLQQLLGPQHPSTQRAFEVLRVVSAKRQHNNLPPELQPQALAQLLDETRRGSPPPRELHRLPEPPAWLTPRDAFNRQYAAQAQVLQNGELVWGFVLRTNRALQQPGAEPCGVLLVHPRDPNTPFDIKVMARLQSLIEGQVPAADRDLTTLLRDHLARAFSLPLDPHLSSAPLFLSTLVVHPDQLPVPVLLSGMLVLAVTPKAREVAMLPAWLWGRGLLDLALMVLPVKSRSADGRR
jgi:hypothetical protein